MNRPSRACINIDALRHNYSVARRVHGGRALAVLKADAYGHGAVRCANALIGMADGYAVAFLEEALELRAAGIREPILLLEGVFGASQLIDVCSHDLWLVVHNEDQLSMIEHAPRGQFFNVWLKVDSGMRRAGFSLDQVRRAHERLLSCGRVAQITLATHFARADEPDIDFTVRQIKAFDEATKGLLGDRSLCNSAGLLGWADARRDWSRPGIMLYGADPMPSGWQPQRLQPVMSLESQIFSVRELKVGEAIGYGGAFVAQKPMRVGLVAVGYADGYPRTAGAGTPIVVDGVRSHLVGRVSMDMLTIDLTELPRSGLGSLVELWGSQVSVNEVARNAGTTAYELLCNVKRVPKIVLA